MLMQRILRPFVLAAALVLSLPAQAQEKLKVGVVLSLSGPPAALGKQALDGFQLGLEAARRQVRAGARSRRWSSMTN